MDAPFYEILTDCYSSIPQVVIGAPKDNILEPILDDKAKPQRLRAGRYGSNGEFVWLVCYVQPDAKVASGLHYMKDNKERIKSQEINNDPSFSWSHGLERPQGIGLKQAEIDRLHKERIDHVWQGLTGSFSRFNPVSMQ